MQEGTDKIYAELHNPTVSFGVDDAWDLDAMRDFADRTHELRMQTPITDSQIEQVTGAKIGTPLFLAAKGFVRATEVAHGIK